MSNTDTSLKFGSILYECTKQGFAIDFTSSLGLNLLFMGFTPLALKAAAVSGTFFTASCTLGKVSEHYLGETGLVSGRTVGNAIKYGAVAASKYKLAEGAVNFATLAFVTSEESAKTVLVKDILLKGALNGALYGASSAWLGSTHSEAIHTTLNIDGTTLDISTAPLIEMLDAQIGGDNLLIGGTGGLVVAGIVKLYVDRGSNDIDYAIGNITKAVTDYFATPQDNANNQALITVEQNEIDTQLISGKNQQDAHSEL